MKLAQMITAPEVHQDVNYFLMKHAVAKMITAPEVHQDVKDFLMKHADAIAAAMK
jgi:hypothetical protein